MASALQCITFSLLSYFIIFISIAAPSPSFALRTLPSDSEKVSLALYYESLCPDSANFIVNYLVKIFVDDLISIIDLKLVPWGNAKIRGNNTFDCQHGPSECLLNTIEACAINVWPDLNKHFPFIYCIETLVYKHEYLQWETCFDRLGLDPEPIAECYSSGYGKKLELEYALETSALQPPHEYVPWVVVDGQPLYEDFENFISYICKAYKGSVVFSACSKVSLNSVLKEKPVDFHPVCYAEEKAKGPVMGVLSAIRSWAHWLVDAFAV